MKRLNKITLCALAALLTLAGCSDDTLLNSLGHYEEGEPVELSLTLSVPSEDVVAVTRAAGDEDQIQDLAVLVFESKADNAKLLQVRRSTNSDDGTMTTDEGGRVRYQTTLEATSQPVAIYIVANANKLLPELEVGTTTLADLRDIAVNSMTTPMPLVGSKVVPIPDESLVSEDFKLYRPYSKVTVSVAPDLAEDFQLEDFYLCNTQTEGSLLPGTSLPVPTDNPKDEALSGNGWARFLCSGEEAQYPFPTQNEWANEQNKNTKLVLLVRGKYQGRSFLYHADFLKDGKPLDVNRNHHYQVTITSVDREGYDNSGKGAKGALAGAENITIDIEDINLLSRHMASDGVTELAMENDTIWVTKAAEGEETTFEVTWASTITADDASQSPQVIGTANWFEVVKQGEAKRIENGEQAYYHQKYAIKNTLANPTGEYRETHLQLEKFGVRLDFVVVQKATFNASDFGSVSLKVKEYTRNADGDVNETKEVGTYANYWSFLRGEDDANPLYGISPEAMGGKVRNEGFHAPMSDYQQFIYTFTLPQNGEYQNWKWEVEISDNNFKDKLLFWNGASSEGDGSTSLRPSGTIGSGEHSFTFTNDLQNIQTGGKIKEDAYRYGDKVFHIKLTSPDGQQTRDFAYDLYHTGVFNYDKDGNAYQTGTTTDEGWYYYEVILMGRNYWLDRNLGAKSSAYYVKGAGLPNDEWPYRSDAVGGLYQVAKAPEDNKLTMLSTEELEKIAPTGFRLPTVAEWQAMTSDRRFRQELSDGVWGAAFHTGKPAQGTVYFPKNGMWYGGAAAGNNTTGYYWTQTEALGASGDEQGYWLQDMQLAGSNASANRYRIFSTGNSNPTGMSVRCVYNSRVVESMNTVEFSVKGYTHVFLYTKDANGNITALNSWPGTMISVYDGRNNQNWPFKLETMMDINYDVLYAVFVTVDDGTLEVESVYPEGFTLGGEVEGERVPSNCRDTYYVFSDGKWTSVL